MDVRMPDGTIIRNVPEGTTKAQLLEKYQSYASKQQAEQTQVGDPSYTEALVGGAKRLAGSMTTGVSGAFGDTEEAARAGLSRQEAISERSGVDLDKVKQTYAEQGLFPAAKEVVSQVPYAIAGQLPNLASTLAGARLGGTAGFAVGGPWGAGIGAIGGAFAPSLIQQAGSNLERQAQEGTDISASKAYGAAVPQAALDVFADKVLFGRLMGIPPTKLGTEAAEAIAKQTLLKTVAKGTGKGIITEMPTEVGQQMLERLQAGLPLTNEDARKEYIETAYQTALLGPLGAIGNIQERGEARDTVAETQQAEKQKAYEADMLARRQATGVMEQQPLFTPEEAPVTQPSITPEDTIAEPTTAIPEATPPVQAGIEPEQMALFGPRGGVTPEAKASVALAREQGAPVRRDTLLQTPEGRTELADNMKLYFPELNPKERVAAKKQIKEGMFGQPAPVAPVVEPAAPVAEGTLTPELLKQFEITPRSRDFYKALVGASLADPMTYQLLVQAAESGTERGIRANRLLEAFPQFNPNQPQGDLFSGVPYGQRPRPEPEQQELFGVQADGIRAATQPTGADRSVAEPSIGATTPVTETTEPDGSGVGNVVEPVGRGVVRAETSPQTQPSALTPKEVRAQERAAKEAVVAKEKEAKAAAATLKKEPIATTWSYFSDIPYAKLTKETKRQVKEAHDQNYLTQEIADTIEGIERKNQRVAAENKLIKPETALDDDVQKPAKIKDLTVTQGYLEEELTRLEDIKNRLANPLPKNTVQAMIQDAVDKWENNARSGVHGRYNAGEIEATKEYMLDAPADYADSLNLPTEVTDALTVSSGRGIEGYRANDIDAAIEAVQSELANERRTRTRLQIGDYASVVESRVADGTIRTKDAPLFNAVLNNDLIGVYSWIEKNALNSNHRLLARLLRRANINPIIEFGETDTKTALAHYDPTYDKVVLDVGNYLQESASAQGMASSILHEVMHSATVNKLGKAFFTINEMSKGWTPTQPVDRKYVASAEFKAAKNLFTTFDWLAKNHPDVFTNKKHYGATNPLELTAEIFVAPTLYKALNDIKLPAELTQAGSMNALTWVIKKIKQLLGIDAAPDSAVAAIMRDTLTLASPRKPYNKRIEATGVDIIGLNDLQKKYDSGNTIAYDPRAQAEARQLLAGMSGTIINTPRTPTPSAKEIVAKTVELAVKDPKGFFAVTEDKITKFRTIVADKNASVAAKIMAYRNGAFHDVNGQVREDMLLSAEVNTGNFIDQFVKDGNIFIAKDGSVQVGTSAYSVDNLFSAGKSLADRIGTQEAKDLITAAFYHYRAASIKSLPRDQWPDNWKQDPRIVPTQAQIQAGLDAFNKVPELEYMRNQFIGAKNNIVKFLNQAGFLTAEKTKAFLADDSYAPWMRIKEYQDVAPGMGNIGRMVDLGQMKKLVGGTEEVNDMLENMTQMLAWGVRSGIKNHTANRALSVLTDMGAAKKFKSRPDGVDPAQIVMTYETGKPTFWTVDNPTDLLAFQSVKALDSAFLRGLSKAMGTLRAAIVLFPVFPVRQVFMDSQRAYMQSGVEKPVAMVGKIFKSFLNGEAFKAVSDDVNALRRYGVAAQVDFNTHDASRGLSKRYGLSTDKKTISDMWYESSGYQFLHRLAYSADLAVRLGIYKQVVEESGDKTLAASKAREIINFQKSGSSAAIIAAKQVIPFLGAYLQGMDVNYRSMVGQGNSMKNRKAAAVAYWSNAAMYMGLVIAYTMANSGDDDYEEQKGYVTDRNFLVPGGFLIPAPPDVGFLAKIIPERITDYIMQEGTESPESAKRLSDGVKQAAADSFLPPSSVYALQPYLELKFNRSFFSNMPIVGEQYKNLEPKFQISPTTSEFAKSVGAATNTSPIKIDYFMNAIGATSAGALLQMADVVMGTSNVARDKPAVVGSFIQKPVGGRETEEYYAVREMTERAYATYSALNASGKVDDLETYVSDPKVMARLDARYDIEQINNQLAQIRAERNAIYADDTINSSDKRKLVDELASIQEQMLSELGIRKLRKELE